MLHQQVKEMKIDSKQVCDGPLKDLKEIKLKDFSLNKEAFIKYLLLEITRYLFAKISRTSLLKNRTIKNIEADLVEIDSALNFKLAEVSAAKSATFIAQLCDDVKNSIKKQKGFNKLVPIIRKSIKQKDNKNLHWAVDILDNFKYEQVVSLYELAKKWLDKKNYYSFFGFKIAKERSSSICSNLPMEDKLKGFRKYLLLVTCFYLMRKIRDKSLIGIKRQAHIQRFLELIEIYNGNSVDVLAKTLEAIPDQSNGMLSGNEFVRLINEAMKLKHNPEILYAALQFDITVLDVLNLFGRTMEVLNLQVEAKPIRQSQEEKGKGDEMEFKISKEKEKEIKQLLMHIVRSEKGSVDAVINSKPDLLWQAIEFCRPKKPFEEWCADFECYLKQKNELKSLSYEECRSHREFRI